MNDAENCQGYLDEDGGRRPGHLVLFPIEVEYIDYAVQQFLQDHISRFFLMEKYPRCRTFFQTHLLLSKEQRALICLES